MSVSQKTTKSPPEAICLKCGLCCNGVIFADIKLQAKDGIERLLSLGLHIKSSPAKSSKNGLKCLPSLHASAPRPKLLQPCTAFDGCRCRIYAERPLSCRQFECRLLQHLKSRDITRAQALGTIRLARRKVEKVLGLLRRLGDTDEQLALKTRFQRTTRRMEQAAPDKDTGRVYGQLTLSMHELNNVLSEFFYP